MITWLTAGVSGSSYLPCMIRQMTFFTQLTNHIRLTNSAPFIEDTRQRDIRLRISERKVDWTNLNSAGVSFEGYLKHFQVLRYLWLTCFS